MQRIIILIIMILTSLGLWSQTAEQILKSNDVIAYNCELGIFLMDVNTGKEVKVPSVAPATQLIWDKTGSRLFAVWYNKNYVTKVDTLKISEIKLPSLQEVEIINMNADGTIDANIEVGLAEDGRLYIFELIIDYDYEVNEKYYTWYVNYYIDLQSNQLMELPEGEFSPPGYYPPYLKKIVTEGYGIKNLWLFGVNPARYELFISDEPDAPKPDYKQLTLLNPPSEYFYLHGDPIEFWVSPNDSLIVYSYHYYINDPEIDYGYSLVISRDGKKQQVVTNANPISKSKNTLWTKDSRLIYCQSASETENKVNLNILDKNFQVKTLKSLPEFDFPIISYRHK